MAKLRRIANVILAQVMGSERGGTPLPIILDIRSRKFDLDNKNKDLEKAASVSRFKHH